jgi:hypothetical protein
MIVFWEFHDLLYDIHDSYQDIQSIYCFLLHKVNQPDVTDIVKQHDNPWDEIIRVLEK